MCKPKDEMQLYNAEDVEGNMIMPDGFLDVDDDFDIDLNSDEEISEDERREILLALEANTDNAQIEDHIDERNSEITSNQINSSQAIDNDELDDSDDLEDSEMDPIEDNLDDHVRQEILRSMENDVMRQVQERTAADIFIDLTEDDDNDSPVNENDVAQEVVIKTEVKAEDSQIAETPDLNGNCVENHKDAVSEVPQILAVEPEKVEVEPEKVAVEPEKVSIMNVLALERSVDSGKVPEVISLEEYMRRRTNAINLSRSSSMS